MKSSTKAKASQGQRSISTFFRPQSSTRSTKSKHESSNDVPTSPQPPRPEELPATGTEPTACTLNGEDAADEHPAKRAKTHHAAASHAAKRHAHAVEPIDPASYSVPARDNTRFHRAQNKLVGALDRANLIEIAAGTSASNGQTTGPRAAKPK